LDKRGQLAIVIADNAVGCEPEHRPNSAPLRGRGRRLLQRNGYVQPMTGMGLGCAKTSQEDRNLASYPS
jgi:hypothetical protein